MKKDNTKFIIGGIVLLVLCGAGLMSYITPKANADYQLWLREKKNHVPTAAELQDTDGHTKRAMEDYRVLKEKFGDKVPTDEQRFYAIKEALHRNPETK